MRIVVLPGLDGTDLLLAHFIKLAPNGITANAIPLPDDPTDDYHSLSLKVAAQLERFAPCHLVAESFSGPVGIHIAFQFPDIVNELTLVASFANSPVSRIVRCVPWSLIFRAPLPLAAARYFFVGPDHEMAVRLRNAMCQTSPATLTKRIHCVFNVDVCSELASLRCWSVALAQILYYHRVQPAGQVSYEGSGYRVRESLDHRFDWDLFADTVTEATPVRKQNEVAKYCYFAAIVIGKDFAAEAAYHGNSDVRRKGITEHFHCTTRRYRTDVEGWQAVQEVILSELAERRPLLLYADPHAFVIDGARGDAAEFEVHLNCGWGGTDNGWYRFERPFKTSRGLLGGTSRWVMTIHPPDQPRDRPINAPSTNPSAADMSDLRKWRTWTTADGRFRVDAKFGRSSSDTVTLEKQDGTTVDVSLEILCAEDRDFIRKRRWTSSADER